MGTLKERLIMFLSYLNIGQTKFEENVGISRGYVNNLKGSMGTAVLNKIANKYPNLNKEWLMTGEGEMLIGQPLKSYDSGVPYYNVDFMGGFDLIFNDQTTKPEYKIDFQGYNDATCWCNITGHSMEPEICHGDIIALKEVKDISFLPYGEIYAIVTKNEMRTVKRLGASSNPDNYTLIPTNKSPEYGIQEIPKSMIDKVFIVLGCMKKF